jgi:hypothetical protein
MTRRRLSRTADGAPVGRVDERAAWRRLPVSRSLEPKETAEPTLEIVSICKAERAGLLANHGHCFVRLIDAQGGVRSVGFFPDESLGVEPDEHPGLRMPGMYLSPDKYDRIDWNPRRLRVALSVERFDAIVGQIEAWQARSLADGADFDLVDRNCVGFVVHVAALAGVSAQAAMPPSDFLIEALPEGVQRVVRWLRAAAGGWTRAVGLNLVLAVLGGRRSLRRRRVVTGAGEVADQDGLRITPMFASWRAVLTRRPRFLHVRALRLWQEDLLRLHPDGWAPVEGGASPAWAASQADHAQGQPPKRADADGADASGQRGQIGLAG